MNQKELKEKIKEIASKWLKEALEDKYITKYGLDGVDVAVDKYENKLVEELSSLLIKPSVDVEKIKEEFDKKFLYKAFGTSLSRDELTDVWNFFLPYLQPTQSGREEITGETSDGYHTFNELYEFRKLYNAGFFNLLPQGCKAHKSKRHSDGELCFGGGWFIVTAYLPMDKFGVVSKQISNHYDLKDWDLFQIEEREFADVWDGHTAQDVAKRLNEYLQSTKPFNLEKGEK